MTAVSGRPVGDRAAPGAEVRRWPWLPALWGGLVGGGWLAAVVGATLWSWARGVDRDRLVSSLVVVLVAGLATIALAGPLSRLVVTRRARRAGVDLIWPAGVTVAASVDTLLLDGLGALVDGKQVLAIEPVEPDHLRNLRWFAGALEHHSDHPVATAIARLAPRGNVTGVTHHPGCGISGAVDRHPVRVGSAEWLGSPAGPTPPRTVDRLTVEVDERIIGTIDVGDRVREDAASGVAELRSLGIVPVLAAGCALERGRAVADQVGIERVDETPTVDLLQALRLEGRSVGVLPRPGAAIEAPLVLTEGPRAPHSPALGLAVGDVRHAAEAIRRARRLLLLMRSSRLLACAYAALAALAAAAGVLAMVPAVTVAVVGLALVAVLALRT